MNEQSPITAAFSYQAASLSHVANDSRALENSLQKAYDSAPPELRAIIDKDELKDINGLVIAHGLELQLLRCREELVDYPFLVAAAKQSNEVAQTILLVQACFGNKRRKFTERRLVHHTFRGAEKAAKIFGVNKTFGRESVLAIIIALGHDLLEDCIKVIKAAVPTLEPIETLWRVVGMMAAKGIDLLTTRREKSEDWQMDIFLKRTAKDAQTDAFARHDYLRPILAIIKANDNADAPKSDLNDFINGSLSVIGNKILKVKGISVAGPLREFQAKLFESLRHHDQYMTILQKTAPRLFDGRVFDFLAQAKLINAELNKDKLRLYKRFGIEPIELQSPQHYNAVLALSFPPIPLNDNVIDDKAARGFSRRMLLGLGWGSAAAAASVTAAVAPEVPPRFLPGRLGRVFVKIENAARHYNLL